MKQFDTQSSLAIYLYLNTSTRSAIFTGSQLITLIIIRLLMKQPKTEMTKLWVLTATNVTILAGNDLTIGFSFARVETTKSSTIK